MNHIMKYKIAAITIAILLTMTTTFVICQTLSNLPVGYQQAKIINDTELGSIRAVIAGDIFKAYPELSTKLIGRSSLEREAYLETDDGLRYARDFKAKRSEVLKSTYLFKLPSKLYDYETSIGAFEVEVNASASYMLNSSGNSEQTEQSYRTSYVNSIEDIWCSALPLRIKTFHTSIEKTYVVLLIKPGTKAKALELERKKDQIDIYMGFKLSGKTRKLFFTSLHGEYEEWLKYAVAKEMAILLVDSKTNEVLFSKMYYSK